MKTTPCIRFQFHYTTDSTSYLYQLICFFFTIQTIFEHQSNVICKICLILEMILHVDKVTSGIADEKS